MLSLPTNYGSHKPNAFAESEPNAFADSDAFADIRVAVRGRRRDDVERLHHQLHLRRRRAVRHLPGHRGHVHVQGDRRELVP